MQEGPGAGRGVAEVMGRDVLRAPGSLAGSVNAPEEEKEQVCSSLRWKEGSADSLPNTWRIQGPQSSQPGWGQSCAHQSKVMCHPTPTRAVSFSRRPRFLWMWSPAQGSPVAQWLSGNQVCSPGLADKGRVSVSQCGGMAIVHTRSWAGERPASPEGC